MNNSTTQEIKDAKWNGFYIGVALTLSVYVAYLLLKGN